MYVLGRTDGGESLDEPPTGHLGSFRARDGSAGAPVELDLARPHVSLVVGKRGSGKSYTLGVVAEAAARASGVAPVVLDPMDVFAGLSKPAAGDPVPARRVSQPRVRATAVRATAVPPPAWPPLLGLDSTDPAGALIWRVAADADTLDEMRRRVEGDDCDPSVRRTAANHLELADAWDVFSPDGLDPTALCGPEATVLSLAGLDSAPANAVGYAVACGLYEDRLAGGIDRLPWLLVDEAHAFFGGVAADALRTVVTRGRRPGVTLVAATQRLSALPEVAVSQTDLLVAHRLTTEADVDALRAARPTYLSGPLDEHLPREVGEALVVDDTSEEVHAVRVRERDTPHGGESPRARAVDEATAASEGVRGAQ